MLSKTLNLRMSGHGRVVALSEEKAEPHREKGQTC